MSEGARIDAPSRRDGRLTAYVGRRDTVESPDAGSEYALQFGRPPDHMLETQGWTVALGRRGPIRTGSDAEGAADVIDNLGGR